MGEPHVRAGDDEDSFSSGDGRRRSNEVRTSEEVRRSARFGGLSAGTGFTPARQRPKQRRDEHALEPTGADGRRRIVRARRARLRDRRRRRPRGWEAFGPAPSDRSRPRGSKVNRKVRRRSGRRCDAGAGRCPRRRCDVLQRRSIGTMPARRGGYFRNRPVGRSVARGAPARDGPCRSRPPSPRTFAAGARERSPAGDGLTAGDHSDAPRSKSPGPARSGSRT